MDLVQQSINFIDLNWMNVSFLFIVGFIGGLVSGFIGSGGAFVLTPGMMSLGVPATVAVASNMCHKFPKALVGAYKRFRYGQVDLKLGLVMAVSAVVGVQVGIQIQYWIKATLGPAGSNLYVSVAFLVVLITVGGYVARDVKRLSKSGKEAAVTALASRLQKIELWPMITFKTAGVRISLWFTIPVGFATGMLAATIAVGGFIGVPGMIYMVGASSLVASATELVIAFVMGFGGSLNWGFNGLIDIRLVVIILAGSLFGVQLGAIGTTYVKDYMIKLVMSTIMLMVAFSRGLAIPAYLKQMGLITLDDGIIYWLDKASFFVMAAALTVGAVIILGAMFKARAAEKRAEKEAGEGYTLMKA
ncbi:MAG: sulfite exporter TauE/SafE family protein [bacterium]